MLHLAAIKGHTSTVEALLDRGCDANIQDFVSYFLQIHNFTILKIFADSQFVFLEFFNFTII